MAINPIDTAEYINKKYIEYLESILTVKDDILREEAQKGLREKNKFIKGPYLEITPSFVTSKSIKDLINEGIMSKEFNYISQVDGDYRFGINIDRSLYAHQEKAIRKVNKENKNIIVATGTGSGKTECFLLPIINYLMKQKEENRLTPGVRALLLYPMNALANDQIKRLRSLLKGYEYITFGRYTGETQETYTDALSLYRDQNSGEAPMKNELISREQIRKNPPNILLTNYAMLEYLLLRPNDNELFDGENSDNWKFIVLDEAHSYRGSNGTEISYLLRRLKERVNGYKLGEIQCIATSATLGGGKGAFKDVANFATDLFSEEFHEEDIIEAEKKDISIKSKNILYRKHEFYNQLKDNYYKYIDGNISLDEFNSIYCIDNSISIEKSLYYILKNDSNLLTLQHELTECIKNIYEIVNIIFEDEVLEFKDRSRALVNLIDMAGKAKLNKDDKALLPARYHLFVRALEGMYASFYPKKKVYLSRKEEGQVGSLKVKVFELANCQKCGQEYIVGYVSNNGYLKHIIGEADNNGKMINYFKLDSRGENSSNYDEDELLSNEFIEENKSNNVKLEEWKLCTVCGKIEKVSKKGKMNCCDFSDSKKYISIQRVVKSGYNLNSCSSCGSISPSIVKRFLTSYNPSTNVLARSLYEKLADKDKESKNQNPKTISYEDNEWEEFWDDDWSKESELEGEYFGENDGDENYFTHKNENKLLVFSDNRQEAAFFGAYMNNKYTQILWRKIILKALKEYSEEGNNEVRVDDLVGKMVRIGKKVGVLDDSISIAEEKKLVAISLIKEIIAIERNTGLEGLGLIKITPLKLLRKPYEALDLDENEFSDLIAIILDSFRYQGAISFPDNLLPQDDAFKPKNKEVFFRLEGNKNLKGKTILSQLPSDNYENKRSNIIKRILINKGIECDPVKAKKLSKEILKEILVSLNTGLIKNKIILQENIGKDGVASKLNRKMWKIEYSKDGNNMYICNKCGKVTTHNIIGLCPEFRCEGTLEKFNGNQSSKYKYYRDIYMDENIVPMLCREHTAQLTSKAASDLQKQFEDGKVNVLSCSTTFEMGVDVGQLEAVFMRNVPPETSNYIQRAGRAGRRNSSAAFVLTFARRKSHDLNYFNKPQKIISGKIQSPYIEVKNEKILKRHMNSIIFSYFFSKYPEYFNNAGSLFENSDSSACNLLKSELDKKPSKLLDSIKKVVPQELHKVLKIDDWGFVEELCGEYGTFANAERQYSNVINELENLKNERIKQGSSKALLSSSYIQNMIQTYRSKSNINYLANKNILPKYGFPVDVVSLDILSQGIEAKNIDISRDLKMAITEFAPGSSIVANGKVWKSHSINTEANKGWPTFEYAVCDKCKSVYTCQTDLISGMDNKLDLCKCGEDLKVRKFIKPEFGFSTQATEPEDTGEDNPRKFYNLTTVFEKFEDLDEYQKKEVISGNINSNFGSVPYKYSPMGKLLLVNKGINSTGFKVCTLCGYAESGFDNKQELVKHKNKFGNECRNTYIKRVDLGHQFTTDVLELNLPTINMGNENLWLSVLFAIIEGACEELDIVRSDINGCLYYKNLTAIQPAIMLYDEAAGGAGHVKKITFNIEKVLKRAYKRVSNCECGEETSCYGCLRNYNNQMYHEKLSRGIAKEYLEKLIKR